MEEDGRESSLARCDRNRPFLVELDEDTKVDVRQHLNNNADEQAVASAEGIDEEEAGDEGVEELGQRVQGGVGQALGGASLDADHAQDRDEVGRDTVGAGELGEDVGEARLLCAAQVGGHQECLAGDGAEALEGAGGGVAVDGLLLGDGPANLLQLGLDARVVEGEASELDEGVDAFLLAADEE